MVIPSWIRVVVVLLVVGWVGWQPLVGVLVDWQWFSALGHLPLYRTSLTARLAAGGAGLVVALVFLGANLRLAVRRAPVNTMRLSLLLAEANVLPVRLQQTIRNLLIAATVLPALLFSAVLAGRWLDLLEVTHAQSFGVQDPVFGLDVAFYVFTLPVLHLVRGVLLGLTVVSFVSCLTWYGVQAVVRDREAPRLHSFARTHILLLAALFFALVGVDWLLSRYGLLFDRGGVVSGIGYTDVHARLPAYFALACVSFFAAGGLAFSAMRTGWRAPTLLVAVFVVARVLLDSIVPQVVQDYVVKPNELALEEEFLTRDITGTREAFGLDRVEVRPFEASSDLTLADLKNNPLTVDNIRVWDKRPLLVTYSQLQEIRTYYNFRDVDLDRYVLNGEPRQVMLSAREFSARKLPDSPSWVNLHFYYTHGYGFTMSPVNVVTREGLPELFVKDIPPRSTVDLTVDRPEIYFGEEATSSDYVFVQTDNQEFDYPLGDENQYTTYAGQGGVEVGTLWSRLLFAMHFSELNILLDNPLKDESRVLFRRNVMDRVARVAPFLRLDRDPYLVVHDGRLVWMLDGYSATDRYPYSAQYAVPPAHLWQRTRGMVGRDTVNYLRNSVKAVVDAYDGTVMLYVADGEDPLVQTWQAIFPESFRPMAEMPDSLLAHIRYPSDLFDAQASTYRLYHMLDPTVFYNQEDVWQISQEVVYQDVVRTVAGPGQVQVIQGGEPERQAVPKDMESYYLMTSLPEEDAAEFILLVPYSPAGRDNMIAWMAARCDPEHYGELVLYQFSKQELIYGPRQIEARIDQDPDISQQLTLWNQKGSQAERGNLLVIPIENSLVYVEPLYLKAASGELPELKRIIVSYENTIKMEPTLSEALRAVFGATLPDVLQNEGLSDTGLEPAPRDGALGEGGLQSQVQQAVRAFEAAKEKQRAGDWAGYGVALAELERALGVLESASLPVPEAAEAAPEGAGSIEE